MLVNLVFRIIKELMKEDIFVNGREIFLKKVLMRGYLLKL